MHTLVDSLRNFAIIKTFKASANYIPQSLRPLVARERIGGEAVRTTKRRTTKRPIMRTIFPKILPIWECGVDTKRRIPYLRCAFSSGFSVYHSRRIPLK